MLILEWLVSRGNDGRQLAQQRQEVANKFAKASEEVKKEYEVQRVTYSEGRSKRNVMDRKYLNDRAAYEKDARLYKDEMKNLTADRKALLAGDKDIQTRMVSLGNHWRLRNLAMIEKHKVLNMHVGTLYTFHLVAEDGNDLIVKPATHLCTELTDMQFRHIFTIPAGVTIVGVIVYDDRYRIVSSYPLTPQKFNNLGTYTLTYS